MITNCQKKAFLRTVFEAVLWILGITAFVGVVFLLAWGIVALGEYLSSIFPILVTVSHWVITVVILILLMLLLITLLVPAKRRYNELKENCEWMEQASKKYGWQK